MDAPLGTPVSARNNAAEEGAVEVQTGGQRTVVKVPGGGRQVLLGTFRENTTLTNVGGVLLLIIS